MKANHTSLTRLVCGTTLGTTAALVALFVGAAQGRAQTVPTPEWLARALTNRPQFAPATNAPPAQPAADPARSSAAGATSVRVGGLSDRDVAMANAVIADNTLCQRESQFRSASL